MVEKDRQALSHSFLLFSAIVGYGTVVFCYWSSEPWHTHFGVHIPRVIAIPTAPKRDPGDANIMQQAWGSQPRNYGKDCRKPLSDSRLGSKRTHFQITLLRVIPTMTFIRFNIGIASGIPPGHWHICKQAIAFFLLCDLLAGLHSRMSPGVTACSSGCKTNMPRHVGVHLHHSCHVACSAARKTNIPRHVGDHLNHSCHVGCSTVQDRTSLKHLCQMSANSMWEYHHIQKRSLWWGLYPSMSYADHNVVQCHDPDCGRFCSTIPATFSQTKQEQYHGRQKIHNFPAELHQTAVWIHCRYSTKQNRSKSQSDAHLPRNPIGKCKALCLLGNYTSTPSCSSDLSSAAIFPDFANCLGQFHNPWSPPTAPQPAAECN